MANQNPPQGPYNWREYPIVWVDLETTGNNVLQDTILEIAVVITDKYLRRAAPGIQYVIKTDEETLNNMVPVCIEMHKASGLWNECLTSPHTKDYVYAEVLKYIRKHVPEPQRAVIGGSSIHFDRTILLREMPDIINYLKYQILDVSSIMYESKALLPERHQPRKPPGRHRALGDIENSIYQLKWYRAHFFKTVPEAERSFMNFGAARAPLQATTPPVEGPPTPPAEQPAAGPASPSSGQQGSNGVQRTSSSGSGRRFSPY